MDTGRVVMVPFAGGLLAVNVLAAAGRARELTGMELGVDLLRTALILAFYLLIIWAYLRRETPSATDRSVLAGAAAVAATLLPLTLPLLSTPTRSVLLASAANLIILIGVTWSVWSLNALGRNLSIIPQARGLVRSGPYRLVRHPLYLGELVAALGIVVSGWSLLAALAWVALLALQCYRALNEERLLAAVFPEYGAYQQHTVRLIPGVF